MCMRVLSDMDSIKIAPEAPPRVLLVPLAPPPPQDDDIKIDDSGTLWWRCNWCGLFRAQVRLRRVERGFCFTCPSCRPLAAVPVDVVLSSDEEEDEDEESELELEAGDSQ